MEKLTQQEQVRRQKMQDLIDMGIDPFGSRYDRTSNSGIIKSSYEDKTKEENEVSIDIAKGLNYKDLTELAYRAKWIEKNIGMEEYEIFSFISSIRDKLSSNLQEEMKRGLEASTDSFFSSCGSRIEVDEISDLLAFVWRRFI